MNCPHCGQELAEDLQPSALLRPRELQVLQCLTNGLTRAETSEKLGIAPSTVKNTMNSIVRSLQVRDMLAAVVYALRERWVALPEQNLPIITLPRGRRRNRVH